MVVIVDLEDEKDVQEIHKHNVHLLPHGLAPPRKPNNYHDPSPPIERSFCRNTVTRAFGQYPIVMSIVQHIDLNTLDSLARTSYLIHQSLIQYRSNLLRATLRCVNDHVPVNPDTTLQYRARAGNYYFNQNSAILPRNSLQGGGVSYNGKSGQCARDLVDDCRKCEVPVCRNCIIKRPSQSTLIDRHRRLCQTCADAPLPSLLNPPADPDTPLSSDLIQRELCQCDQKAGVWLCQPCGRGIRTSDSDYSRIWHWRNQYGEVLGGLGTGIGDGDRGVICGREGDCLAAKEVEQETDCDAADARESSPSSKASSENAPFWPATSLYLLSGGESANGPHSHLGDQRRTPSPMQLGPGYERHEIVGIGGVVKRKLVRVVRVGACVPEWEDERSRSGLLRRERLGQIRSFCGWCCRVIPAKSDHTTSARRAVIPKKQDGLP